ncbi:MAG: cbb3-type cytochrome c oxidase subunit I [Polyangia bacterium]
MKLPRVFSLDHKVIGLQYLWLGLVGLLAGGIMSMLIRFSVANPGQPVPLLGVLFGPSHVISPAAYTQLFTLHGTVMIFFAITPITIGAFGNYLIPLLIGARDMAFPRLNAASFWVQFAASLVLVVAAFDPSVSVSAGWTAYPPLSTTIGTPGLGLTLWSLSLILAGTSSILGAINFITTTLALRAPGMSLMRMPLTVWGLFLASVLNALFVPVISAAMMLLLSDRTLGTRFFIAQALVPGGGDPLVYLHLFWIFGHPEVYILILPTWGVISDLFAWYSGRPAWGYRRTVAALCAITLLSGVVYGHHMYTTSMSPLLGRGFMVLTMVISVPGTVMFLDWMGTLWRGKIRYEPAMLFSLGVMVVFAAGGLTGLYLADVPIDLYLHDTYFVVGHFHLTMAAAVLLGTFAAIYHWYDKMFGRTLDRTLGQLHFWLTLVPLVVVFVMMLWMGHVGLPRRLYDASTYEVFRPLAYINRLATWTAYVLGLGQLVFVWNFVASRFIGAPARANPFGFPSLEWSTSSPPPTENFAEEPEVVRGPHEQDGNGGYLPQRKVDPS